MPSVTPATASHHNPVRRWMFDEDHFYIVFIAAIVAAVVIFGWHPWEGPSVLDQARTAQTALRAADATLSGCLPSNTATTQSATKSAQCERTFADDVQAISWPDTTTRAMAAKVSGDARSLAAADTSGAQPGTDVNAALTADRALLSTDLSSAVTKAGG